MSKYIVSLLGKYSRFDNEIPVVYKVVAVSKKPTLERALVLIDNFNKYFDKWCRVDDETWQICNDLHEEGSPACLQVKIQTPKRHKEMVNNWIEYIKINTTPR